MRVADIMTTDVITILVDAPISDAIAKLADSHVSGLAVVDHRHRLLGVVSATDILAAEAEADDDRARAQLRGSRVGTLMSNPVLTVPPDLEVREAALQMEYADVHRLFVAEGTRLIGVISRSDVNRIHATGKRQDRSAPGAPTQPSARGVCEVAPARPAAADLEELEADSCGCSPPPEPRPASGRRRSEAGSGPAGLGRNEDEQC